MKPVYSREHLSRMFEQMERLVSHKKLLAMIERSRYNEVRAVQLPNEEIWIFPSDIGGHSMAAQVLGYERADVTKLIFNQDGEEVYQKLGKIENL